MNTPNSPPYSPRSPLYRPSSPTYPPSAVCSEYESMDFSEPFSPLYAAAFDSSPKDIEYEALEFSSADKDATYTRESTKRKRIYGEEYKEPTLLFMQPQCKILKIEQPQPEEEKPESRPKSQHPYPTKTERNFAVVELQLNQLIKLCQECYNCIDSCICNLFIRFK